MTDVFEKSLKKIGITVFKPVLAAICVIFGVIVIVFEEVLAIAEGIFLMIQGILLLMRLHGS